MQERDAAMTKGPADIRKVRTKRTFSDVRPSDKTEGWYLYAAADLYSNSKNEGKPLLRAYTWTKFTNKIEVQEIKRWARRFHVELIATQHPPRDVL